MLTVNETELLAPTEEFRQGDILRFVEHDGHSPDPALGIIINADCDLAHCRIDGVISYLPIYNFRNYFRDFWIPTYLNNRRIELLRSIGDICGISSEQLGDFIQWIKEETPNDIIARCVQSFQVRKNQIESKIIELSQLSTAQTLDINLLKSIWCTQGVNVDKSLEKLSRQAVRDLGDGQFFMNEIQGISELGFVIRMRRIYSIESDRVFSSSADSRKVSNAQTIVGIRIARLTNLYRFRVAQIFANQYSRIGLPDEITALNELAAHAAIANIEGL